MGEEVLVALGMPPEQAADHAARFREHDNNLLRAQHLVYDDDVALRQTSHESRVDLMQLFAADSSGSDEPAQGPVPRSVEHTSELQSLMRSSYAVLCLTQKNYVYHTS